MEDIKKRASELIEKFNGPSISDIRKKLFSEQPVDSKPFTPSLDEILFQNKLQTARMEVFDFGKELDENADPKISVIDPPTFRYVSDLDLLSKVDELIKKEESFLPIKNLEDDGFDWE